MSTATYDEIYARAIANGESPLLADMLASRQAPGARGVDRNLWQDQMLTHGLGDKDPCAKDILAEARAAGIPTTGKIFVGALARPGMGGGDPLAWVSDIHDMRESARRQNKCLSGVTNYVPDGPGKEEKPVQLAEDLVQEMMQMVLAKDPSWATDPEGLREYVIKEYGTPDYSPVD